MNWKCLGTGLDIKINLFFSSKKCYKGSLPRLPRWQLFFPPCSMSGWVCNPLLPLELGQNDHHIASGRFWTILDHIWQIFKVKLPSKVADLCWFWIYTVIGPISLMPQATVGAALLYIERENDQSQEIVRLPGCTQLFFLFGLIGS